MNDSFNAEAFLAEGTQPVDTAGEIKAQPQKAKETTQFNASAFLDAATPVEARDYTPSKNAPDSFDQLHWGWRMEKNWGQELVNLEQAVGQPIKKGTPPQNLPRYLQEQGATEPDTSYYTKRYGEDFEQMSFKDRVKRVEEVRQAEIKANMPDVAKYVEEHGETGKMLVGRGAAMIVAPETLIGGAAIKSGLQGASLGTKIIQSAKAGAVWSGIDRTLGDLADEGEINPTASVASMLTGATLVGGTTFLGVKLAAPIKKHFANKLMGQVEREVIHKMAEGMKLTEARAGAFERFGVNKAKLSQLEALTGRSIAFPKSTKQASALVSQEAENVVKAAGERKATALGDMFRSIYDRIYDRSKPIYAALQRFENNVMQGVYNDGERVSSFLYGLERLPKDVQKQATLHLLNGEYPKLYKLLHKVGPHVSVPKDATAVFRKKTINMIEEAKATRKVLDELYYAGRKRGMKMERLPGFFPRLVKDPDKLIKGVSAKSKQAIDKAVAFHESTLGQRLTQEQRTKVANKVLQGLIYGRDRQGRITWTRRRKIEHIRPEQLDAYASPTESLHTYIHKMRTEMHKRELLGLGKVDTYDTDASIGAFLTKFPQLSTNDNAIVKDLLKARFVAGEQHAKQWMQKWKSITYGATLGNPIAATTQFQDIGFSAAMHGIGNTFKGLFGKKYATAIDMGMTNASIEMVNVNKTSHWVNKLLKVSGFQWADRMGKTTILNARYHQLHKMANKSPEKLYGEIGHLFLEKEWPQVLKSLKTKGEMNSLVRLALFDRVTQMQPITLGQMPRAYLNNPDMRFMYTLKSFMLRQLGTMYNELVRGFSTSPARNTAQAAKLLFFIAGTGATVGQMQALATGRWDDTTFTDSMFETLLKTFGGSSYAARLAGKGRVSDVFGNMIVPAPISVFANMVGSPVEAVLGKKHITETQAMQYVPFLGRFLYYTQKQKSKKHKDQWGSKGFGSMDGFGKMEGF